MSYPPGLTDRPTTAPPRDPATIRGPSPTSGPDTADVGRDGSQAYADLTDELRRHSESEPGDPGHRARRDHLIIEFLPMVRNVTRRYVGAHSAADLEQVGVLGLIKALDRYDPDATAGGPLAYLVPSVRGEVLRHLRDHTWSTRVGRGLKDLSVRIQRITPELTQTLGRPPRPSELATALDVTVDHVVEALGALNSYHAGSLDEADPESGLTLGDRLGVDDPGLERVENQGDLRRLIGELPERERTILLLRFYGGKTQTEIGAEVGISQMHVSRLLTRTLSRMRHELER